MVRLVACFSTLFAVAWLCSVGTSAQDKRPAPQKTPHPESNIYPLSADSQEHPDVPKGRFIRLEHKSKIYANTDRDIGVYVPANYDSSRPHRVMVFLDGVAYASRSGEFRVSVVLDNLIHKKELPPMICIYMQHGYPLDAQGRRITDERRTNEQRSLEYDTVSPKYAQFLEEEILPKIGAEYNLTKNPAERAICGRSSGGICAFTVAWHRPDLFRKVISHYGSFVNIREGYVYPSLIRKGHREPKPLRVFLQAGANDLDNAAGNWALANQDMAAALKFAKYDYRFEYGVGGHTGYHGGSIFPETLKWIWRPDPPTSSGSRAG